tara:strand:+ start:2789 stop:3907 length:1119 start_codon:yes stop_codon:yes gene_type:complete
MKKIIYLLTILLFACSGGSSVEYRTATTALRNDRDYNKAEEFAKKALELNPGDALPAYFLAMEVYGSTSSPKQDYKQAAYYFAQATEIDAIDGEDQKLEAPTTVMIDEGTVKELKTIKEAIEYYSYNLWAESFNQGINLIGQGNNNKAIELFIAASNLQPNEPKTYNALSTLYYESGDYLKSEQYADKALAIDANMSTLWSIKGSIAIENNDTILAEEMFQKAYNTAINNGESAENLSGHMSRLFDVLFKNNKKDEALLLSEKLIESDPENIDLYRNAGAVYQNILNDNLLQANEGLANLNTLNEMELENLKVQFTDCINFAQKARENFLMCSEIELDEVESQIYYDESKKLKSRISEIKRIIKDINKKLDE